MADYAAPAGSSELHNRAHTASAHCRNRRRGRGDRGAECVGVELFILEDAAEAVADVGNGQERVEAWVVVEEAAELEEGVHAGHAAPALGLGLAADVEPPVLHRAADAGVGRHERAVAHVRLP